MNPRFQATHLNARNSVFLGTQRLVEHGVGRDRESDYDLYLVWTDGGFELVSRFGNRPDQEYFGYGLSFGKFASLTEARKIAESQGLIPYDIYAALSALVPEGQAHDCTEQEVECLHELVSQMESSAEMRAFEAFRARDLARTQTMLKDLMKDANRRGVQGTLSYQLRLIMSNVLRVSTIVTTLKGLQVNTASVVQAMGFRAPKLVTK